MRSIFPVGLLVLTAVCAPRTETPARPSQPPTDKVTAAQPPDSNPVAAAPDKPARPAAADSLPGQTVTPRTSQIPPRIASRFPAAVACDSASSPFSHGIISDRNGIIGYEVASDAAGTTSTGFGGPVPLRIWLDTDGKVIDLEVLTNDETPAYLRLIMTTGLVDRIRRCSPDSLQQIDAVTGATLSSRAIIEGTRLTVEKVRRELITRR